MNGVFLLALCFSIGLEAIGRFFTAPGMPWLQLYGTVCSYDLVPRDIQSSPHRRCRLARACVKYRWSFPVPWCVFSTWCHHTMTDLLQSTDTITLMERLPHHRLSLRVSTLKLMNTPPKPLLRGTYPRVAGGQTPTRRSTAIRPPLGLRLFRRPRRSHASVRLRLLGGREASRIVHARAPGLRRSIAKGLCTTLP